MSGRSFVVGWKLFLALGVLLVCGTGVFFFLWQPSVAVPEIPLEDQEAEVAEAVESARAKVLSHPRSGQAWGDLGRLLLANEFRLDIALQCFEQAAQLDPANPRWPYFSAGILSVDKGRPDEAIKQLRRAVELAEKEVTASVAPRLMLAESLVQLGEEKEAEGHYYAALKADPNNARAHYGLAQLTAARGEWEVCRGHLEACLNSPEARQKAAVQLANVCERLSDAESAARYATYAVQMPKDIGWTDPYVAENLSLALRKRDRYRTVELLEAQGEFGRAASILARMVEATPDEYLPHLMLGRILPQMGKLEKGEQHLLTARKLAPEKIQTYYLLSLVYYNWGQQLEGKGEEERAKELYEKSVEAAREVLAQKPDYGFAHMALGLALKKLGQADESLQEFRQAVHCSPEYADNHLFLGEALAARGEFIEARRHLEQAKLLANPADPRPQAALDKLPADGDPASDP